jgi:hypothetical protein
MADRSEDAIEDERSDIDLQELAVERARVADRHFRRLMDTVEV